MRRPIATAACGQPRPLPSSRCQSMDGVPPSYSIRAEDRRKGTRALVPGERLPEPLPPRRVWLTRARTRSIL